MTNNAESGQPKVNSDEKGKSGVKRSTEEGQSTDLSDLTEEQIQDYYDNLSPQAKQRRKPM